jgi:4-alpha-glucanotransferase
MHWTRSSGILLHPTSLPGPHGIGDFGKAAYRWIDFLARSRQRLWQVLPLGPTGYADSPYACLSAFAGNPLLISLDLLLDAGDLAPEDLGDVPVFPEGEVDYGRVITFKTLVLERAARRFAAHAPPARRWAYERFAAQNAHWLDDYALFAAAKEQHGLAAWSDWETGISLREAATVVEWEKRCADRLVVHKVLQFFFAQQWQELKAYANERHIQVIGDVPIFVAHDSADVWAHRDLFHLDAVGRPTLVSGVPPDYFSDTGQRWGNPLYRWEEMAERGYQWWIARVRAALEQVDIVRIDHFRGFVAYWEIPASEPTAVRGRWAPGPGAAFFETLEGALGRLPILAEDLGVITPEVVGLRERFGIPGMKILQFAFDEDALRASFGEKTADWRNPFLPHNYGANFVAYSGTHDNETTSGWLENATPLQRQMALDYLGCADAKRFHWAMVRAVLASVADLAIVPMQDVLGLGSEARMNHPGTVGSNWTWRCPAGALTDSLANRLARLVDLYER